MSLTAARIAALVAVTAIFSLSCVQPPWPREQALQSTPTIAGLGWLLWHARRLTLSPADAEAYNGQHGDIWDAHMEMLLATLGALLVGFSPQRQPSHQPLPA